MLIGSHFCVVVCVHLCVNMCLCVYETLLLYKYICGGGGDDYDDVDDVLMVVAINHIFAVSFSSNCMCRDILHRFHFAKQFPYSNCSFFAMC